MVSFNSRYVENQVREILRRTIFPGVGRMPLLEAQVLTHECLTKRPNAIRAYWGAVAIVRVKPVKQCN